MSEEKQSILKEANKIIYGDREKTYGHPAKNLMKIAELWNAYLDNTVNISPKDVACMMILLKTARLGNNPDHRDSVVDIAGYAALIERCDESVS